MKRHIPSIEAFERKYVRVPESGCWLWIGSTDTKGYGQIRAGTRASNTLWMAHRASYLLYLGVDPGPLSVLHKCDTPACVNPYHLMLGTQADNMRDMRQKGRWHANPKRGADHANAKLTEPQVQAIRADNRKCAAIARDYGVARTTISGIRARRLWAHV